MAILISLFLFHSLYGFRFGGGDGGGTVVVMEVDDGIGFGFDLTIGVRVVW